MRNQSAAMLLILLVVGGDATKLAQPVLWSQLMNFERFVGLGESAYINEYIDNTVPAIRNFMQTNGLDPMPLPALEEDFSVRPLLVTYHGQLLLDNGRLTNLVSMRRSGDAWVSYFAHMMRLRLEFGFSDLEFEYDYLAKVMNIGPTGGVRGSLASINVVVDILIDFNNDEAHLQEFSLTHGGLRVRLTGNILYDWLVSPVVGIFTRLFHNVIIGYVETVIEENIIEQIARLNAVVKEIMKNLE